MYQWPLPTVVIVLFIQSDMLIVYHSPTHLFSHVHFSHSSLHQLEQVSHLQLSPVPLQFSIPDVIIATDAHSFGLLFSGIWFTVISQWI